MFANRRGGGRRMKSAFSHSPTLSSTARRPTNATWITSQSTVLGPGNHEPPRSFFDRSAYSNVCGEGLVTPSGASRRVTSASRVGECPRGRAFEVGLITSGWLRVSRLSLTLARHQAPCRRRARSRWGVASRNKLSARARRQDRSTVRTGCRIRGRGKPRVGACVVVWGVARLGRGRR